ncbi:sorbitol dehydrogenase-like [Saccoglossus kowalevskii]|uniref:Sorbitol dehydrogenase n=1 Tax=Saccoglossus kowalevskii TaxID=10224 RepID=A0ABM0GT71_SACKO|nr:PREDICTED: sorbitol dehydrogenase-like [Saccoglossus kowalevskii]
MFFLGAQLATHRKATIPGRTMALNTNDNVAVFLEKGVLTVKTTETPTPAKHEVLIAVDSVGICGTDVHIWMTGNFGDKIVKAPLILGHEPSGVVAALGEGVTRLKVGDRVAIEPSILCRTCDYCKRGRYNLCTDLKFCGVPPTNGTLVRYYCHPDDLCHKLPDHVSLEEGAMLETLAVGVYACERAGVTLGSKILIGGAGSIGLVTLLTAKAMGATDIVVTDIDQSRLECAKQLGADYTMVADSKDVRKFAKKIEHALGCMPDIAIECCGAPSSVQTGIYATKPGGVVCLVGLGPDDATIPISNAITREINIRTISHYGHGYPTALSMVASGKIDVKPLVTHKFPLAKSLDAFEAAKKGENGTIRVMIKVSDTS